MRRTSYKSKKILTSANILSRSIAARYRYQSNVKYPLPLCIWFRREILVFIIDCYEDLHVT